MPCPICRNIIETVVGLGHNYSMRASDLCICTICKSLLEWTGFEYVRARPEDIANVLSMLIRGTNAML